MIAGLVTETLVYHPSDLMYNVGKILGPTQYKYVRAQMWGKLIVSLVYMTGEV